MRPATLALAVSTSLVVFGGLVGRAESEPFFTAGTTPWERPAAAPVITEMQKTAEWYGSALTGVEQPYPASLRFLEDQGAWFTPFIWPGMTGPYDIRHWHDGQ
ncbi:hypothetical protein [Paracoccus sp. (in: a-proteobacteria)]|uniref:hypothetical protein n=1 Tax=Paracoccus sp. TaxID=267 RepID=UPI002AFF30AE|nr:hypothetical protein [Paracoccus sp. (in: a-proteobacteria)]